MRTHAWFIFVQALRQNRPIAKENRQPFALEADMVHLIGQNLLADSSQHWAVRGLANRVVIDQGMGLDHNYWSGPDFHAGEQVARRPEERIAPVGLLARHPREIESSAQLLAVQLI